MAPTQGGPFFCAKRNRRRLCPAHTLNRLLAALPKVSQQRRDELRTEPRTLTRGRIRPARIRSARVAWVDFQDFQEVPEAPEAQEVQRVPGGLLGLLRRPALMDLGRQDHLFRPLLPRDLEALEALRAPETNRNHSTQASSQKPRPAIFFA
jgi:hypothetical protein